MTHEVGGLLHRHHLSPKHTLLSVKGRELTIHSAKDYQHHKYFHDFSFLETMKDCRLGLEKTKANK